VSELVHKKEVACAWIPPVNLVGDRRAEVDRGVRLADSNGNIPTRTTAIGNDQYRSQRALGDELVDRDVRHREKENLRN